MRHNDQGHTMPELLVSVLIAVLLTAGTAVFVVSALNLSGQYQANTASMHNVGTVTTEVETLARTAGKVTNASTTVFSFLYQRGRACELHTYTFAPSGSTKTLTHAVRAVTVGQTAANPCSQVNDSLLAGTQGNVTSSTVLSDLDSSSAFQYYTNAGTRLLVPGDTGYTSQSLPNCRIGLVKIVLTYPVVSAAGTTMRTDIGSVNVRGNSFRLTC